MPPDQIIKQSRVTNLSLYKHWVEVNDSDKQVRAELITAVKSFIKLFLEVERCKIVLKFCKKAISFDPIKVLSLTGLHYK